MTSRFEAPRKIMSADEQFVCKFLNDCVEKNIHYRVPRHKLYDAFCEWWATNGYLERYRITSNSFGMHVNWLLKDNVDIEQTHNAKVDRQRCWLGIKLLKETE